MRFSMTESSPVNHGSSPQNVHTPPQENDFLGGNEVISSIKKSGTIIRDRDSESGGILSPLPNGTVPQPLRQKASGRSRDLHSAKKQLDATSAAFLKHLEGAAQRRKHNVTSSSRDFVVASKEQQQQQLLFIEAATNNQIKVVGTPSTISSRTSMPASQSMTRQKGGVGGKTNDRPFKALPLPFTNGEMASGGQFGLTKIPKRPRTIPRSPLLGSRRPGGVHVKVLGQEPPIQVRHRNCERTNRMKANGLQHSQQHTEDSYKSPTAKLNHHNSIIPYNPHSTVRAKKRAQFKAEQNEREKENYSKQQFRFKSLVQGVRKELNVLRKSLG